MTPVLLAFLLVGLASHVVMRLTNPIVGAAAVEEWADVAVKGAIPIALGTIALSVAFVACGASPWVVRLGWAIVAWSFLWVAIFARRTQP